MAKICTSIKQSKKLIELGIDADTSDMVYLRSYFEEEGEYNLLVGSYHEGYAEKDDGTIIPVFDEHIPAWSLSALLRLMPKLYELENDPDDDGCQPNLCKGWNNNQWHIVYRSSIYITEWYDDPIDAAFEMVCWLLENGKI